MKHKEKILLLFLVLGLVLIGCGAAKSAPSGEKTERLNLYGVDFSLEDEELDLSYIRIGDGWRDVLKTAKRMPNLKRLVMDSCGVENEDMATIRDALPDTDVIWRVDFGGKYDPTLLELLTHTSAYEDYRTNGFFQTAKYRLGKNPYKGVSSECVPIYMKRFSTGGQQPYEYGFSNFGYAVLGNVVESIEGRPFSEVMTDYIRNELGFTGTGFAFDPASENAWAWERDDAFLPAAGLT